MEVVEGTSRWDLDFWVVGGIREHFIQSVNLKILSEVKIGKKERDNVCECWKYA